MGSETTLVVLKLEICIVSTFLVLKLFAAYNLPHTADKVSTLATVVTYSTVPLVDSSYA